MGRAGCCSSGQSSVKLWSACLLISGAGFPRCWLLPEATQHWRLQAPWWGEWQTLGGLTPRSTSQNFCCQCPCPCGEPQPPPASAGDPPTLVGRSGSVSYGVTDPSPWVLMHTLLYVCPPRVESLFPPVLLKSCSQIPLVFKVWFSRNSSSQVLCPTPGWEAWRGAQNLHFSGWTSVV